jgi:branched-chain amino acid transport system permease protein
VSGGARVLAALRGALLTGVAGAALLFPMVALRVDAVEKTVSWRWANLGWAAAGLFAASLLWQARGLLPDRLPLPRKDRSRRRGGAERGTPPARSFERAPTGVRSDLSPNGGRTPEPARDQAVFGPAVLRMAFLAGAAAALAVPPLLGTYQVSVLTSALISVILGLGLNVIVGLAGLLNLGYAAFYAVGAYAYALLNRHFGLGFWGALPAAGLIAAGFGLALGFPVLRLRGDYLAIVTLGFGEIVRLVLENWSELANGPSGIAGIPRASLPGFPPDLRGATLLLYYVSLALAALAALVVARLRDSRIGRAWLALREDETAAEAMGIDRTRTKLAALALGAGFAGVAGVLFAARTTFVNPASFTFLESAMVLAIVVLGGPGSVGGVVVAALLLVLLPEYLRPLAQYRMLAFGAALVLMMIARARRPGGGQVRAQCAP